MSWSDVCLIGLIAVAVVAIVLVLKTEHWLMRFRPRKIRAATFNEPKTAPKAGQPEQPPEDSIPNIPRRMPPLPNPLGGVSVYPSPALPKDVILVVHPDGLKNFQLPLCRGELLEAINAAELMLRKHDEEKGDSWKTMELNVLYDCLINEYQELYEAYMNAEPYIGFTNFDEVKDEALDLLAVSAMFTWRLMQIERCGTGGSSREGLAADKEITGGDGALSSNGAHISKKASHPVSPAEPRPTQKYRCPEDCATNGTRECREDGLNSIQMAEGYVEHGAQVCPVFELTMPLKETVIKQIIGELTEEGRSVGESEIIEEAVQRGVPTMDACRILDKLASIEHLILEVGKAELVAAPHGDKAKKMLIKEPDSRQLLDGLLDRHGMTDCKDALNKIDEFDGTRPENWRHDYPLNGQCPYCGAKNIDIVMGNCYFDGFCYGCKTNFCLPEVLGWSEELYNKIVASRKASGLEGNDLWTLSWKDWRQLYDIGHHCGVCGHDGEIFAPAWSERKGRRLCMSCYTGLCLSLDRCPECWGEINVCKCNNKPSEVAALECARRSAEHAKALGKCSYCELTEVVACHSTGLPAIGRINNFGELEGDVEL